MSTDAILDTQRPSGMQSHSHPPRVQHRGERRDSSQGRWRRRGLLAIGVVAVAAPAATLIQDASSSRQIGPQLTYTITRDDLLVTSTLR